MEGEVLNALIDSLNDPNAGWVYSEYTAKNNRIKCEIWLSSGPDGMRVSFWGDKISPPSSSRYDVVAYEESPFFGVFVPWRWKLYLVAQKKRDDCLKAQKVKPSTIVAAIRSASESS